MGTAGGEEKNPVDWGGTLQPEQQRYMSQKGKLKAELPGSTKNHVQKILKKKGMTLRGV